MRRASFQLLLIATALSGCTSTQLRIGTVNVASTVSDVEKEQIVANFGEALRHPYFFPAQVTLTGGTIQVVNSVTPSIMFPLSSMFVRTVSAMPSEATTTSGGASTLSGTISMQQNFNIVPIVDPLSIRNLTTIYRAVVHCQTNDGKPSSIKEVTDHYTVPRMYSRNDNLVPDPALLVDPICVRCLVADKDGNQVIPKTEDGAANPVVAPNATVFDSCWLHNQPSSNPLPRGMVRIGSAAGRTFYISPEDEGKFEDFELLTLVASPSPTRFAALPTPVKTFKKRRGEKPGENEFEEDFPFSPYGGGTTEGQPPRTQSVQPGIQPGQGVQ